MVHFSHLCGCQRLQSVCHCVEREIYGNGEKLSFLARRSYRYPLKPCSYLLPTLAAEFKGCHGNQSPTEAGEGIVLCPGATGASVLGRWGGFPWPLTRSGFYQRSREVGGGRLQIQLILAERRQRAVGGVALQLLSSAARADCLPDFQGALGTRDSHPLIRGACLTLPPPCSSDSASFVSDLHSCHRLCRRPRRLCGRLCTRVCEM